MKRFIELKLKDAELPMGVVLKKPTNADRIRSMSDAQLVQMLTIGRGGFSCSKCAESEGCGQNCEVQCLKWLQQPAEEADNETAGERKDGDGNVKA